ncbi:potassium channel family protein [Arsenicicoccus sp. oral taxon 190]|uniref:potassium channel family protein n=1 Tax=Arsenicicoccus sp. oral taxon 190 TaxID=1658671 RepID=UPI00067A18E8|nr:TrkA family potassium uptake protein [Arsenicicoccus sp. oral taxon 190]AKT52007.1 potassium transporter TrkA [Arsenicicoccus sp. oral taxon 190]
MRVVIAGAGSVGRSIARELLHNGHQVLLVDKDADDVQASRVPDASWLLADACEITSLTEAGLADCDVVVAATGDDKANLVVSLLAKTEFGVPRTVARVNNPRNEWMFDESWGVDVAVSTPRLMTALVEEAVSVGDLVQIFTFQKGGATMVELTLPADSPYAGSRVGDVALPRDTTLVGIIRDGLPIAPTRDDSVEVGDELLFLTVEEVEDDLEDLLSPGHRKPRGEVDHADDEDDL